jgi:hypothetical protein
MPLLQAKGFGSTAVLKVRKVHDGVATRSLRLDTFSDCFPVDAHFLLQPTAIPLDDLSDVQMERPSIMMPLARHH